MSLDGGDFVIKTGVSSVAVSNSCRLGRFGSGSNYWAGRQDVFNRFDKALTLAEVKSLYQAGDGTDYFKLTDQNGDQYAIGQKFDGAADAFNIDSVLTPLASTTTGEIEIYLKPTSRYEHPLS